MFVPIILHFLLSLSNANINKWRKKIYSVLDTLKFHWNECEYAFELSSFVKSLEWNLKKPGWNTSCYFDERVAFVLVQRPAKYILKYWSFWYRLNFRTLLRKIRLIGANMQQGAKKLLSLRFNYIWLKQG